MQRPQSRRVRIDPQKAQVHPHSRQIRRAARHQILDTLNARRRGAGTLVRGFGAPLSNSEDFHKRLQ
jgi:hypothetical protein